MVLALTGAPLRMPEGVRERDIAPAALHHGIAVAFHRGLRLGGADSEEMPELTESALRRRALTILIRSASVEVSHWLTEAGVAHAIVKGPAIAAAYQADTREYVDLDVLVEPSSMHAALAALHSHACEPLEPFDWPRADGIGQLTIGLPSGVCVDLHADLIHTADVRREFRLPSSPLLSRAVRLGVGDESIPVLDPEDSFIHVALHAMLSGGDRLIWLADLDALVRQDQIRWPVVIERARDAKLALVVSVMSERARLVLGTPIPSEARRALRRGGALWSLLLEAFERRRPTASSFHRSVRGQVLVRATRDSTLTSFRALARLIWTDVIVFVVRYPNHPWRTRLHQRRRRRD